MKFGQLYILSAPSGTGKTTILKKVMANLQGIVFSVSHTTRNPRKGEVSGVDYHFVGTQEFQDMIGEGHFLEYAEVHNNFYGTSRIGVLQQIEEGFDVILDIDVQGARIIRDSQEMDAVYIFLAPPGITELEQRLRKRDQDSEETIRVRLKNAREEMTAAPEYEYLVVNDKIEDAVTMIESIILAQRCKNRRTLTGAPLTIEGIR